jgi:hypothetical protein
MRIEDLPTSETKATFKDLLLRIGSDLELQDATSLLELLVCGNIISCDLEIEQVFERLWLPYLDEFAEEEFGEDYEDIESLPMRVIYRLVGVDGDATEPVIDNLETEEKEKGVDYTITSELKSALPMILVLIENCTHAKSGASGGVEKSLYVFCV